VTTIEELEAAWLAARAEAHTQFDVCLAAAEPDRPAALKSLEKARNQSIRLHKKYDDANKKNQ